MSYAEKASINEYLYYEFGFDCEDEEIAISDNSPFTLEYVGSYDIGNEINKVYAFKDEDNSYYAIYGNCMSFFIQDGLTIDDLKIQDTGSVWIGKNEPVDLNTSKIGDEKVPPLPERREKINRLIIQHFDMIEDTNLLEGLFLRTLQKYLVLIEYKRDNSFYLIYDDTIFHKIEGYNKVRYWRLLSICIGKLLNAGALRD